MNRRSKQLAVVGCITALATFAVLLPPREDDLDWIRRYSPIEQVRSGSPGDFGTGRFATRWHIFQFKEIPPRLIAELKRRTEYHARGNAYHFNGTFPDTDRIMLIPATGTVEVWMHERENWVEVRHRALRNLVCLR